MYATGVVISKFYPPNHHASRRTIVVANHDTDAHNFVIDPSSPSGGAFIITGTDGEPPSGWQRSLVVQQPGLYHVYCSLHTDVVGQGDQSRAGAARARAAHPRPPRALGRAGLPRRPGR
jgi:hypothetical protein